MPRRRKLRADDEVSVALGADGQQHLILDNQLYCGADAFPLDPDRPDEYPWCAACEEAFNSRPLTLVK